MEKERKTYYYESYEDDLIQSKNQNYKLKEDYKWLHNNIFYNCFSYIAYVLAYVISLFYCKFILHIKIKNREVLKKYKKQGYFLYGNHTQPIGDVFTPAHICRNKRIYVVVSPSNLGVTGIGPLLPMLGALPIPSSIKKMSEFYNAIKTRIKQKKCVVIYPEAHVWPCYTKIRPFDETAFNFPISLSAPSFCMTTTYYKRKFGKKPGIIVYVDGPFNVDENLNKKEKQEKLFNQIYQCMENRSKNSTYEYVKYEKGKKI